MAPEGSPNRDPGQDEGGRGCFAFSKTERHPHKQRETQEFQGIVAAPERNKPAEHNPADNDKKWKQDRGLNDLNSRPPGHWSSAPKDQERSYDDVANSVSQPPGQPHRGETRPGR